MGEHPQSNIQKKETKKRRAPATPAAAPSDAVTNINMSMNIDEEMLKRIAAENDTNMMAKMPNIMDSMLGVARDMEMKQLQSKMGDRLFPDLPIHGLKSCSAPGTGAVVLVFGDGRTLSCSFNETLDEKEVRFDRAAGIHTRFLQHMTPTNRAERMWCHLEMWRRRRALTSCTVGPDANVPHGCVVRAAFSDCDLPITMRFAGSDDSEYATYEEAAKAAVECWERVRKWKVDADAEPADLDVEFLVFQKRHQVYFLTRNTKCLFTGTYYNAQVQVHGSLSG